MTIMIESLRGENWGKEQREAVSNQFVETAESLGISKSLEDMDEIDKPWVALLVEVTMSAYGLNIDPNVLDEIVGGFYHSKDSEGEAQEDSEEAEQRLGEGMTTNHDSLAIKVSGVINTPIKYAPVIIGRDEKEDEIGNVSPLHVERFGDGYVLVVDAGPIHWELGKFEFIPPPPHAVATHGGREGEFIGKVYVDSCVAYKEGGHYLGDPTKACQQNCLFCEKPEGAIIIDPERLDEFEMVLESMANTYSTISITLSGGSTLTRDRGIKSWLEPSLKMLKKIRDSHPNLNLEVGIEVLPWNVESDGDILESLIGYYYDEGVISGVTLNLETPTDVDRYEFMNTGRYGKATIPVVGSFGNTRGYLDTFRAIKARCPDMNLSGLILYGLKPKNMSWEKYNELCAETVKLFASERIRISLQPLKIKAGRPLAGYPLPNLYWLTKAVIEAARIRCEHGLGEWSGPGCVGGCGRCAASFSADGCVGGKERKVSVR